MGVKEILCQILKNTAFYNIIELGIMIRGKIACFGGNIMPNAKDRRVMFKKTYWQAVGVILLLLIAVSVLWYSNANSYQAESAFVAQVRFWGEYRIGDGPWQEIVEGQHISATEGDVTLRGNFHMFLPDGEYIGIYSEDLPIAFYCNHINLTFYEKDVEPNKTDTENPIFGNAACRAYWDAYILTGIGSEEPIEIVVHNPHKYGNEKAIDEMLANVALWTGVDFQQTVLSQGRSQRNTGWLFVIVSLVLLGTALFSSLLHIQNSSILWLLGLTVFFAGGYMTYGAVGVSFWSESVVANTMILGASKMFYMLFLSSIITYFLKGTKKIGAIVTFVLGIVDGICFLLPLFVEVYFYDSLPFWILVQMVSNAVLTLCLIKEFISSREKNRWVNIGMILPLLAFAVDAVATGKGYWEGGLVSQYVFFALFIAALFVVLRLIPENIIAAEKAKELEVQKRQLEAEKNMIEAELKESRISIMLSQIQPHFIYNTLGTIERMCLKDPQKAFDLVRNFSLYLRGNFSELDSVTPIRFTEELEHIEYYVNIEKVRFPDMNIEYDVETTDFVLPALSVQPLVENAIKHGLMRLETGGTVTIHAYETPTHFCVEVKDNGVGFDTSLPIEEKKHVGLRNIRGRLKAMVNGELLVKSELNVGTKAVIMIPKEVTQ